MMKLRPLHWLSLIGLLCIALPMVSYAQSNSSFWILLGTKLKPIVNTYRVDSPGGFSGTTLTISGLKNCAAIKTNANGSTSCTSISGSFGTGNVVSIGDSKYVNIGGDTMTGALVIDVTAGNQTTLGLNVRNTLSGAIIRASSGYYLGNSSIPVMKNLIRQLGSSAGDTILLGTFTNATTGGGNLRLSVEANGSGISAGAQYFIPMSYGFTGGTWQVVQPMAASGYPSTSSLPFAVDVTSTTFTWQIRFRALTNGMNTAPLKIRMEYVGDPSDTFSESSTTGTATAPTTVYQPLAFMGPSALSTVGTAQIYQMSRAAQTGISYEQNLKTYLGRYETNASAFARSSFEMSLRNGSSDDTKVFVLQANGRLGIGPISSKLEAVGQFQGTSSGDTVLLLRSARAATGALTLWQNSSNQNLLAVLSDGTLSGSVIKARTTLASSGTLVWEGAGSGASLWLSRLQVGSTINASGSILSSSNITARGTLSGALLVISNLHSCSLSVSATGAVICGVAASSTPEVGTLSFSGAVVRLGNTQWVKKSGDTMTGTLVINVTGGSQNTLGLRVINTASGAVFHAEKTLSSSGTLVWEGTASGARLWVSAMSGAGLSSCTGGNALRWSAGKFSCAADANSTYTAAQGLTLVGGSAFRLNSTITGSIIQASASLASSGTLVWETTASGASLWSNIIRAGSSLNSSGSLTVEGTTSGSILYISRNSTLSAANITFSASGQTVFNARSIGVDLIMKGATAGALFYLDASADRIGINKSDPRTTLDVNGTVSGSIIKATTISGSIIRSQYAISPTCIPFVLFGTGTAMTTGSGKTRLPLPYTMSGARLGVIKIFSDSSGVGGTAGVQLRDVTKGNRKLLSTVVSIDSSESGSTTAATPAVIDATKNDIGLDDIIYMDVTSIHSTRAAKGLSGYTCWYR